jgi:hypothetical protein
MSYFLSHLQDCPDSSSVSVLSSMKWHDRLDHSARQRPGAARLTRAIGAVIVFAAAARTASAQAKPAEIPPPPPDAATPRPKPAGAAQPVQWWCEINALPDPGAELPPDQVALNYFVSQVISRPRRAGPEEIKTVQRLCRTAFEVQFGGQWQLVTARAQQAATPEAAKLGRLADLRTAKHEGHSRDFRIPG